MIVRRLSLVLLAAALLLAPIAPLAAQGGAPSEAQLAPIRTQIQKGQHKEALEALKALPDTSAVLRLRIDAAIGISDFPAALNALDSLRANEHKDDLPKLIAILRAIVDDAGKRDEGVKLEACKVLLAHGTHPCRKALTAEMANTEAPYPSRLQAAGVLAEAGDEAALAQYRKLASTASERQLRSVIESARTLPPAVAVPALELALASPEADIQYSAAATLGEKDSPASRQVLTKFLAGNPNRFARAAAASSLAALGDEEQLKAFTQALPDLQGGDLQRIGTALLSRGDPRGVEALTRATKDDHELIRISAAAALAAKAPEVSAPVLKTSLASPNPLIRAAALDEFRRSPLLTIVQARGFLLDSDLLVRIRAADAVFARVPASPPPDAVAASGRKGAATPTPKKK